MIEIDLSNALSTEAMFANQPALFEQAVQADQKALEVYTKSDSPQDWARTQANLGSALSDESMAANGEKAAALADQAVQAYRNALEVFTRADLPQDWAQVQASMGYALWLESLSVSPGNSASLLDQAVKALENALQVRTKANLPQDWAWTQEHLALALRDESTAVGVETSTALLDQAMEAYQNALEVYTKTEMPREWAETEMGVVELSLRAGRFDACLQYAQLLTDDTLPPTEIAVRDTMQLACQWGSGDKNTALATERTFSSKASGLPSVGVWDFTRTIQVLSVSPAFASGRASWIALFTSAQNGDTAGMTSALHQLEPLLQQ
jgi:tetratricopeptide (TPR) repeat protein